MVIEDLQLPPGPATLLANRGHVDVSLSGSGTRLTFDRDLTGHFSPTVSKSSATRCTKT